LVAGDAVPRVDAGSMEINNSSNYTQMGQQIAHAVYRGMGS
jgi:hypothetical protein